MSKPLQEWLAKPGNKVVDLATAIGVSKAHISLMAAGKRTITAETAIAIERETGGEITRQDLRPDLWPTDDAA